MVRVGITGGIGSGKSLVCEIFSLLGAPVYNADKRAKELMNQQVEIRNQLVQYFGAELYKNGELDRKYLAGIIFRDKKALDFVNSVVHPAVGADFLKWCENLKDTKYCIKEAALLFESGLYHELDVLVTVVCPEEIRINRVMQRDTISKAMVLERMNNQWKEDEKVKLSDFLIINDNVHSLLKQINELHTNFLS